MYKRMLSEILDSVSAVEAYHRVLQIAAPAGSPCCGRTAHCVFACSTHDAHDPPCEEKGNVTMTRRTRRGGGFSSTSSTCVESPTASAIWSCVRAVVGSNVTPNACLVGCFCVTFQSRGCVSASVCVCKYIIEGALAQPVHAPPPLFFELARTLAQPVAAAVSLVQPSEQQE